MRRRTRESWCWSEVRRTPNPGSCKTAAPFLRQCVTVVKPGETLVIRGRDWTPNQVREIQRVVDAKREDGTIGFKVLGSSHRQTSSASSKPGKRRAMNPDGVQAVRIRGLAERAASPEHRLGPDVTVPGTIPVPLEFRHRLRTRSAHTAPPPSTATGKASAPTPTSGSPAASGKSPQGGIRKLWPYLAVIILVTDAARARRSRRDHGRRGCRPFSVPREHRPRPAPVGGGLCLTASSCPPRC